MKAIVVTTGLILLAAAAHAAPQPEPLGTFGKWAAYRHEEGKGKPVCYMATPPSQSTGKYKKRDAIFLMITNRPGEKSRHVVSHVAGYGYDENRPVVIRIDDMEYPLIAKGDMAWTPNQKSDDILAAAIRDGNKMTVTGHSKRGTETVDVYDLKGSGKALETIDKACGL